MSHAQWSVGLHYQTFFAIDGLFDTFLTVLKQMDVFPAVIEAEKDRCLPFFSAPQL